MAYSVISEASGDRVFVFGDIHGCPKEPEILLRYLEDKEGLDQNDLMVFLGDYIDRGPDSKAVIEVVIDLKKRFPNTRFLKGNHEDMMLDFLGFGGNLGQAFLYNGGLETIQSYGISVFSPANEMVEALPPEHFRFFCELESILMLDKFVCVHAGLNPLRDLETQQDDEAFWIRDEFLNNIHSFEKTVVFGHTPHQEVFEHLPYKMGIDTGLVFGNKLTCVELTSGKVWQVKRDSTEVEHSQVDVSLLGL